MPLHKYMIEHLLYPAMEQHKGNQIRAILNELQLSQKANAPAVQYQRLIKLLLHCKQHVPAYAGLLPDDSVILTDPMAVLRTRIPLLPKPDSPRCDSVNSSTCSKLIVGTGMTISCAIRSPISIVNESFGSVFTRTTFNSPR